jgi:hypothetical protein
MPTIEAEYHKLTRDYDVTREQHRQLLQRREKAEISEQAENADELQFQIIDPPRVPTIPASPNRSKWLSVILLLGLGVGVGLAFVIGQMKEIIYDRQTIKEFTDVPLLGSVPLVPTPDKRLVGLVDNIAFAAGVLGLFGVFIMLSTLVANQSPLLRQLSGISPISI